MNETGKNPEISFHISSFLNLYYSLEVATGTIKEGYNEEYAAQMNKVFPEQILKKFKQLHEEQMFSWRIKSCLFDEISENGLKESMFLLANQFGNLLNEAYSYYQAYWETVEPTLEKARNVLQENKKELEKLLGVVSDLLRMPWRINELQIQLVDPFTGEPVGENVISLGIGPIASISSRDLAVLSYFFILHEAQHIFVGYSVRKMALKYITEEHAEYIDEAVMNLITNSILKREKKFAEKFSSAWKVAKRMKYPPTSHIEELNTLEGKIYKALHEKRNRYITYYKELFQEDWEDLLKKSEEFLTIIETLLKENIETISREVNYEVSSRRIRKK